MKHVISITALLLWSCICNTNSHGDSLSTKKDVTVIVIPVEGNVNAALAAFISRAIREGGEYPDRVYVLEMDSFGGEVDAAFQIVDTLVNVRNAKTIAYVKTKAISAGALIALACDKMVMRKSTTIGDVAPLTMSKEGPKMLGEKFQSPIRAKFRTLAKRNGYPQTLTEAMVTEGLAVYKVELPDTVLYLDSTELADLSAERKKKIIKTTTVVKKSELLTMDDSEAHDLGFSKGSVESFDEMLALTGLTGATVIRNQRSWSEIMVAFIATIAPILMMIGLAALYIELRTPGFSVPGIVGIVCLAIVFLSQYLVGLADYTELLLLAIGFVLLAVEIFVLPGFGVVGIAGILVIMIAMVLSLQSFVLPRPEFPWEKQALIRNLIYASGSLVGAIVIIVLFFRYAFPRLGAVVSGPYLNATLRDAHAASGSEQQLHTGDRGVVVTALRPSGKAQINKVVYDVVAESMFIEKGEPVVVSEIAGNRIVVVKEPA
ncbi:MAG: ATP-dependent Clp protease proteolytic subunit [Chitinispirillaceae bacterium]|nr:ATP-dependent Clp protease proteolytic subunit [Chitinispirillaceae bacterium]